MQIPACLKSKGLWLGLGVSLVGVWLGWRFNIPGGPFTGAMILTGLVNLWLGTLEDAPKALQTAARAVLGVSIGASVTRETIQAVARSLGPVVVMVVIVTLVGILAAWAISRYTKMGLPTALCGAAPGALPAMVALSEDLGGEAPLVATMHLVRLVSILLIVPTIVTASFTPQVPSLEEQAIAVAQAHPLPEPVAWGLLVVLGVAAAWGARRLGIPSGDLLAPMAVAALLNPTWLKVTGFPEGLRLFSHWIIGLGVGASITMQVLKNFRPFALAGVLMTVFLIASGFTLGWLLSVIAEVDLLTAVLGCAPGGATPLIILAGELGADSQLVAAMHVSRMLILTVLLPVLIRGAANRLALREAHDPPGQFPPVDTGSSGVLS